MRETRESKGREVNQSSYSRISVLPSALSHHQCVAGASAFVLPEHVLQPNLSHRWWTHNRNYAWNGSIHWRRPTLSLLQTINMGETRLQRTSLPCKFRLVQSAWINRRSEIEAAIAIAFRKPTSNTERTSTALSKYVLNLIPQNKQVVRLHLLKSP